MIIPDYYLQLLQLIIPNYYLHIYITCFKDTVPTKIPAKDKADAQPVSNRVRDNAGPSVLIKRPQPENETPTKVHCWELYNIHYVNIVKLKKIDRRCKNNGPAVLLKTILN